MTGKLRIVVEWAHGFTKVSQWLRRLAGVRGSRWVLRGTARMNHRPLPVKLISLYLWLKAAALTACTIAVHLAPSTQTMANGIIEGLVPTIMALKSHTLTIWLAPIFVLVDTTLATGIWFLQKWARIVVVIDLTWLYGRALFGLPVALAFYFSHKAKFHSINLPASFEINIVAGILILAALCDPDVKRAFGMRF